MTTGPAEFALVVAVTFVGMEVFSYLVHRFLYHGLLWIVHRSHHAPRTGPFEWNDVFPFFFSSAAIAMLLVALTPPVNGHLLAVGIGVSLYGMVYFTIHDLYVHRRVKNISLRIPFLLRLKKAHALHHRTGGEPYGLLFFADFEQVRTMRADDDEAI